MQTINIPRNALIAKRHLCGQNQNSQINAITFFMRTVGQHSDEPKIQTHVWEGIHGHHFQ